MCGRRRTKRLVIAPFLRALLATTAVRPVAGQWTRPVDDSPYEWWAPERALQMFEFLSEPIDTSGPQVCVRAHH